MPEIQRVSHTHVAIMDFMLSNPGVSLGMVAAHFKYSQPWLSCIIHSDIFQAMMREKQGILFHHTVLPIREKMMGIAANALDRIAEKVQLENDLSVLSRTTEGVLDRLGFGTKPSNTFVMNQTNNTQVNVLREELDDARKLIGKLDRPQIGVVIDESGKQPVIPALSGPGATYVGADDSRARAAVQAHHGNGAAAEEGAES